MKKYLLVLALAAIVAFGSLVSCSNEVDSSNHTHTWVADSSDGTLSCSCGATKSTPYCATVDGTTATSLTDYSAGEDISIESDEVNTYYVLMNGGNLTVDAPNSTLYFFGEADSTTITAVAGNSFHVKGSISTIDVSAGRVVVEENAEVEVFKFDTENVELAVKSMEDFDTISVCRADGVNQTNITKLSSEGVEEYKAELTYTGTSSTPTTKTITKYDNDGAVAYKAELDYSSNPNNPDITYKDGNDNEISEPSSVSSDTTFSSLNTKTQKEMPVLVSTEFTRATYRNMGEPANLEIASNYTIIFGHTFQGSSTLTKVVIPSSVTNIGRYAFDGCTNLEEVTIPNTVTTIGEYAFWNCKKLTSINIPSGLTTIEAGTFRKCTDITSFTIPESVTSIGEYAFAENTGITSINIPDNVKTIGEHAFRDCTNLESVVIPASVTSIADGAFYGCTSLTSITFEGTEAQWNSIITGFNWAKDVPATTIICSDNSNLAIANHEYGDPNFVWNGTDSCTLTFTSTTDPSHTIQFAATITSRVKTAATCTTAGVREYKATVGPLNGNHYYTTRKTAAIPATGHSYSTQWTYDSTHHWHASTCGHDVKDGYTEHTFQNGVCSVCGALDIYGVWYIRDNTNSRDLYLLIDGERSGFAVYENWGNNHYFSDAQTTCEFKLDNTLTLNDINGQHNGTYSINAGGNLVVDMADEDYYFFEGEYTKKDNSTELDGNWSDSTYYAYPLTANIDGESGTITIIGLGSLPLTIDPSVENQPWRTIHYQVQLENGTLDLTNVCFVIYENSEYYAHLPNRDVMNNNYSYYLKKE